MKGNTLSIMNNIKFLVQPKKCGYFAILLRSFRHCSAANFSECKMPSNVNRFHVRFCTNHTTARESFDDFRAREEKKEQEFTQQQSTSNNKDQTVDDDANTSKIKAQILNAALDFVPAHGWSKQAISMGAESISYSSAAAGMFPRGGVELVYYFYKQCNEKLVEYLKTEVHGTEKVQNPAEFAKKAIEVRLRMLIPYLKHWPQAMGLMTLPPNVPTSLANVLTLVDDICYYAGDRSVDFNWYTRRLGLASIYKATELYMLQDNSTDFERTWKFLARRMEEATVVHDFLIKSEDATVQIQNALGTAFSTARNILGLNFDRR